MMKKILFVDDDPVFHYIHDKVVQHLGIDCEVRKAFNGIEALDILSGNDLNRFVPDYIFVDLDMPVMDGFCFIKRFQGLEISAEKNPSIIVLTSSISDDDHKRAVSLGVENYIIKPMQLPDLLKVMQC